MKNSELKQKIKESGVYQWQIAEEIGICDMTLQRWLRSERDTSHQDIIIKALNKLKGAAANE